MAPESSGWARMEQVIEGALWRSRGMVALGVVMALAAAVLMLLLSIVDFVGATQALYVYVTGNPPEGANPVLLKVIKLIDDVLIGAVLIVFSFGLYELFISEIDPARMAHNRGRVLDIPSVESLKTKLGKLILMLLIVRFFSYAMSVEVTSPLEMLMLAGGIGLIALSLFLSHAQPEASDQKH